MKWRLLMSVRVPGPPVPKGRARTTRNGRMYTPNKTRQYVKLVATLTEIAMRHGRIQTIPAGTPARVDVCAVFRRPKALYRQGDPDGRIPKGTKPDRDNIDKAILEGLEAGGIVENDSQVCDGRVSKWWGAIKDRKAKTSEMEAVYVDIYVEDQ